MVKAMDAKHILDMISENRRYIKRKSNIALQNLSMLHRSFDGVDDEECLISLALNDSFAALIFGADYAKAIEVSQNVLNDFPYSPHTFLIAAHIAILGRCHVFLTRYDQADEYLMRAEALAASITPLTEDVLGLKADILHDLAMNTYHAHRDDQLCISYLDRALALLEGTDFSNRKGICLIGIGNIRKREGKHQEALDYYMRALPLFEDVDNYTNISTTLCNIGNCHTGLGQYDTAETYILRSLDTRTRMGTYWEIANSYYNLAQLYDARGDADRAYEHMLISRDYAMVCQTIGIQQLILRELEAMARRRGDMAAADMHHAQLMEIESSMTAEG